MSKPNKRRFEHSEILEPAKNFLPHDFSPKAELIGAPPRIFLSRIAYEKIWHYVDLAPEEVGWFGIVREVSGGYLIEDVFLVEQKVGAVSAELTAAGMAAVGLEILKRPDAAEILPRIRFWGHSHVDMPTNPSFTDEEQMMNFRKSRHPYFIGGIFNKQGRAEFVIYFYDKGLKICDAEWSLAETFSQELRQKIEEEMKAKVRKAPLVIPHTRRYSAKALVIGGDMAPINYGYDNDEYVGGGIAELIRDKAFSLIGGRKSKSADRSRRKKR